VHAYCDFTSKQKRRKEVLFYLFGCTLCIFFDFQKIILTGLAPDVTILLSVLLSFQHRDTRSRHIVHQE